MRTVKRYRYQAKPKPSKLKLVFFLSILFILIIVFVPGHNGLVKVLNKSYQINKIHRENENLKIKAELIELKIAKGQDPEYLKKYLRDCYQMVSKDSSK